MAFRVRRRPPTYSGELSKSAIRELIGTDDPVVLEIGCNDGTDTATFLTEFARGVFHCFECDPRAIRLWRDRISDPRAHLYEVAVSDEGGVGVLHLSGGTEPRDKMADWNRSSSLLSPKEIRRVHPWLTFDRDLSVQTVRLDTWAAGNLSDAAVVDFVWMDVQGAEGLVISGGAETFARTRFCYLEVYEEEMYAGQPSLTQLLRLLPCWRLLGLYAGYNALLANRSV